MVILSDEDDTGLSISDFKRWSRKKGVVVFRLSGSIYYYHYNGKQPIPIDVRYYYNNYIKPRVLSYL
jgi:hypothetical protein